MTVRLTKYGNNINKKSKKRTSIPSRKTTLFNRRKSSNVPICPPGMRLINGICTKSSGIGFNGKYDLLEDDFYLDASTGENAPINPELLPDISQEITRLRTFIPNYMPAWLSKKAESIIHRGLLANIIHTCNIYVPTEAQLNGWLELLKRSQRLDEPRGMIVIESIIRQFPNHVKDAFVEDEEETRLGLIIAIAIIIAIVYYATK